MHIPKTSQFGLTCCVQTLVPFVCFTDYVRWRIIEGVVLPKSRIFNEFVRVIIMAVHTKWSGQFDDVRISTIELYRVSNWLID